VTAGIYIGLFVATLFDADMDEVGITDAFVVISVLMIIPACILNFIVGFKLKAKLEEASSVALAIILCAAGQILCIILAFFTDDEWIEIIYSVPFIYFFYVLATFFNQKDDEVSGKTEESLSTETESEQNNETPVNEKGKASKILNTLKYIIYVIIIIFVAYFVWDVFFNENDGSKKKDVKEISNSQKGASNLITSTSIAGVKVIGKAQKEVKSKFDKGLAWTFYEDDEGGDGIPSWIVKKGETLVFILYVENGNKGGKIVGVGIFDTSYSTVDGLQVGSTSGDVLEKYPNATVRIVAMGDMVEYTEVNGITFFYDSSFTSYWEENVGKYSNSNISKIINKVVPISSIWLGNWGNIGDD
jgi:hypothetical protein